MKSILLKYYIFAHIPSPSVAVTNFEFTVRYMHLYTHTHTHTTLIKIWKGQQYINSLWCFVASENTF